MARLSAACLLTRIIIAAAVNGTWVFSTLDGLCVHRASICDDAE